MSIFTIQVSEVESEALQTKHKSITRLLLERVPCRPWTIYVLCLCIVCYIFIIAKVGKDNSIARRFPLVNGKQTVDSYGEQNSLTKLVDTFSTVGSARLPDCAKPSPNPVEYPWWADDRTQLPPLNFTTILAETLKTTESATENLPPGGHWRPPFCKPQHNIAILVPYRNRPSQLKTFIDYMHPFLQRQNIAYTIYIVEQGNTNAFNRALLFNIGFVESKKIDGGHDCYYFHDVDLLPENDNNLYNCPKWPRHHSVAIDTHNYSLLYKGIFGGVTSMKTEHFELINGFSNLFYGWGGEDDDFFNRAKRHMEVIRYPKSVASYTMMSHKKEDPSPIRMSVLGKCWKIHKRDGLNSLCYRVQSVDLLPTYTRIVADFKQTYQFKKKFNSTMTCDNGESSYDVFDKFLDKIRVKKRT